MAFISSIVIVIQGISLAMPIFCLFSMSQCLSCGGTLGINAWKVRPIHLLAGLPHSVLESYVENDQTWWVQRTTFIHGSIPAMDLMSKISQRGFSGFNNTHFLLVKVDRLASELGDTHRGRLVFCRSCSHKNASDQHAETNRLSA